MSPYCLIFLNVAQNRLMSTIIPYCRPESPNIAQNPLLSPRIAYCRPIFPIVAQNRLMSSRIPYCRPIFSPCFCKNSLDRLISPSKRIASWMQNLSCRTNKRLAQNPLLCFGKLQSIQVDQC